MEKRPITRNVALLAAAIGSLGISHALYERSFEDLASPAPITRAYTPVPCMFEFDTHQLVYSGNDKVANPDPCDISMDTTGYAANTNYNIVKVSTN